MQMPSAVQIHVPVYEKTGHAYRLEHFMRVGLSVESTRQLIPALGALVRAPSVVFVAGECRHFMCFEDGGAADAKTGLNVRWGYEKQAVEDRKHDGEEDMQTRLMWTSTAMAFFDRSGRLTCLPIRDYLEEYPSVVPGSQMLKVMERIAQNQARALLRLVGQLCLVNVVCGEVASTERVSLAGCGAQQIAGARLCMREARGR